VTERIDESTRELAEFKHYMAANPMATYWSTWQARANLDTQYKDSNELSPAYLALTAENDRLRRLLAERGTEHEPVPQRSLLLPERLPMVPYQTVDRGSTNYKAGFNAAIKLSEQMNTPGQGIFDE
jgi:hypothetical protein